MYTVIEGTTTLIGVAYARALVPGEADPTAPAGASDWHFPPERWPTRRPCRITPDIWLGGWTRPGSPCCTRGREYPIPTGCSRPTTGPPVSAPWFDPARRSPSLGSLADLRGPACRSVRERLEQSAVELGRWWSRRPLGPLSEEEARIGIGSGLPGSDSLSKGQPGR